MEVSDLQKNRDEAQAQVDRLEAELARWREALRHCDRALNSVQGITNARMRRTSAARRSAVLELVAFLKANHGKSFSTPELLLVIPDWPIRKLVEIHNGTASQSTNRIKAKGEKKARRYFMD